MTKASKKTVFIFHKHGDSVAEGVAVELSQFVRSKGFDSALFGDPETKLPQSEIESTQLAVVVGGDGTFLNFVRRLSVKDAFPIMGINLGTLGFITEFSKDEIQSAIEAALTGKLLEERRFLLDVELTRSGKSVEKGTVFNDVVLNKDTRTSLAVMDVTVNGRALSKVRADGYIIATSTGSTGYALSAGGPLIHPDLDALILVPICSHSLSSRPVVIPADHPVQISVSTFHGKTYLVFDGQINIEVEEGDIINIRKSSSHLRLLRSPDNSWTDVLKEKLRLAT